MSRTHPDRSTCARMGREAVEISSRGSYVAPSGAVVDIREAVRRAVLGTREILPGDPCPYEARPGTPVVRVTNESSIAAAARLASSGDAPAILNFASAKNPGGGFLGGARAQEESLARSSALYPCLLDRAMYPHHREHKDCMYADWIIHSPTVPVFRGADGALLERPFLAGFLTSPAANAGVALERDPSRRDEVTRVMRRRVRRVLGAAAGNGYRAMVLGAWGCGVFGNEAEEIAALFHEVLAETSWGEGEIVFAVLDRSAGEDNIGPFRRRFG